MIVLKFGGTSLGSPKRMKHVAQLIHGVRGRKIIVLSAISGVTNILSDINDQLTVNNPGKAINLANELEEKYQEYVSGLYDSANYRKQGKALIDEYMTHLYELIEKVHNEQIEKEILIQGEMVSTNLFKIYNQEIGIKTHLVNATDFMRVEYGEPVMEESRKLLQGILDSLNDEIIVTQGYVCLNNYGLIDNLNRGGSDFSATIIGACVLAEEVQIWTDIDGMHNNDPRIVENTMPIAELSYEEAGELAYFGAKILHPNCIHPAQKKQIPVRIKNTLNPQSQGTLITSRKVPGKIKSIAVKDGITAIKIKSTRMVMAYGFLRKIFEVFEKYKTSIDIITTSEIAVSLSIDDPSYLSEIVKELEPYGYIEVDKYQSIVCIVGDFVAENKGLGKQIFISLEDIPVRMISYGGSKNNITVLIDTVNKKVALESLNNGLFNL
ncbi:MAG TPA: aspartate kinase [Cyclobacteriaceae bacterium]